MPVRVDLQGRRSGGIIGYKARSHAGLVDIDRIGHYEVDEYREPARAGARRPDPRPGRVLHPRLAGGGARAARLRRGDDRRRPPVGEFRVHYAGFFDPGFGHGDAGGEGSRAVARVRSNEVPFVLEHGQLVGRLAYERLTATPAVLYGRGVKSSIEGQRIKLSKHFKTP